MKAATAPVAMTWAASAMAARMAPARAAAMGWAAAAAAARAPPREAAVARAPSAKETAHLPTLGGEGEVTTCSGSGQAGRQAAHRTVGGRVPFFVDKERMSASTGPQRGSQTLSERSQNASKPTCSQRDTYSRLRRATSGRGRLWGRIRVRSCSRLSCGTRRDGCTVPRRARDGQRIIVGTHNHTQATPGPTHGAYRVC